MFLNIIIYIFILYKMQDNNTQHFKRYTIKNNVYGSIKRNDLIDLLKQDNKEIHTVKIFKSNQNVRAYVRRFNLWYILFDKIKTYDVHGDIIDAVDTNVVIPTKVESSENVDKLDYIQVDASKKIKGKFSRFYGFNLVNK